MGKYNQRLDCFPSTTINVVLYVTESKNDEVGGTLCSG